MCPLSAYYLLSAYTFLVIKQNAMIELHTARNAESTEKLMSPQARTPPLRSLFAKYTANQPSG